MHDIPKASDKIDFQADSCRHTQTAYDKQAAAEEKFEALSKKTIVWHWGTCYR